MTKKLTIKEKKSTEKLEEIADNTGEIAGHLNNLEDVQWKIVAGITGIDSAINETLTDMRDICAAAFLAKHENVLRYREIKKSRRLHLVRKRIHMQKMNELKERQRKAACTHPLYLNTDSSIDELEYNSFYYQTVERCASPELFYCEKCE